jgi:ketosteroid isomerase-like protein
MKRILLSAMTLLSIACGLRAETAPDAPELTKLLKDFLAGAGRNDAAMHERFWADDLIYTASAGRRIGKADILREVREEGPPKPGDETAVYTAEEIRIQQYGDTAIVAFRLVATTEKSGAKTVANYLNTGTFLKRNGKWQAVSWQATAIPKAPTPTPTPQPKKSVEQP